MNKIGFAVVLIVIGIILMLKNSNLLPDNYCTLYLDLAHRYWPGIIILFGFHFLVKEKYSNISRIIIWIIFLLVGLWVVCKIIGQQDWVAFQLFNRRCF